MTGRFRPPWTGRQSCWSCSDVCWRRETPCSKTAMHQCNDQARVSICGEPLAMPEPNEGRVWGEKSPFHVDNRAPAKPLPRILVAVLPHERAFGIGLPGGSGG